MFIRLSFPLCCLLLVLLAFPALSVAESARFLTAKDGDSFLVEYKGRTREIRLIGIDAPEWGQEYGNQAKSQVMSYCYGRTIRLEFDQKRKDRYGRLLAYVYCEDKMLNEEMVRAGLALAVTYKPNTRHQSRLEHAEKQARKKGRGFWLRGGLKQTPSQWRKAHGK